MVTGPEQPSLVGDAQPLDLGAQLLGAALGVGEGGLGQHEHELLAAEAAGHVFTPEVAEQGRPDLAQERVARVVVEVVVDPLEVVEIEHEHGHGPSRPLRAPHLALQRLLHVAPVEEAGEGIADRLAAQHLAEAHVGEPQSDVLGHGGGDAPLGSR